MKADQSPILGITEKKYKMTAAPFLTVEEPYERALAEVTRQLGDLGLHVIITFDLPAAQHMDIDCSCPHHGTDLCDCRLGVLLVYGKDNEPASLLVHGHDGKTWFSLVDTPQQPIDPGLCTMIRQSLLPELIWPAKDDKHVFR